MFKDFPGKKLNDELSEAQHWAKNMIDEAKRRYYRDPYWTEYPLIQRHHINYLQGDNLFIFRYVRSNPTVDLYHLYLNSGYSENDFYQSIHYLVRKGYLKIFSVYYSIDYAYKQGICNFITKHAEVFAQT